MNPVDLLRSMLAIRAFEEALMRHPAHGFQLLSSGQEAVSVGVCSALEPRDALLTSGRSIAPALARGLDPKEVMAELLGKSAGPCSGRGGRGHLAQPARGFFGAHAVVAGNIAIAGGVALALQMRRPVAIAVCIFGDGACGSGALHETLNVAALWKLPLLFVCDNNGYSISTPQSQALAPVPLSSLAVPFRIPSATVDGMDVLAVRDAALALAKYIRAGEGPAFLECLSRRFATHSTSTRETRNDDELASDRARCPIARLTLQLRADGTLDAADCEHLQAEAREAAADALRFADEAPFPDAADLLRDVI